MAVKVRKWNGTGYDESVGFAGATLGVNYHYFGDGDGDYFPTVWDGAKVTDTSGEWLSTDATPEVVALARAYTAKADYERRRADEERAWLLAANKALDPAKGDTLTVVRGRKVPIGTKGTAFWIGETAYGMRVGFTDADGATLWTALDNVAFDPDPDRIPGFYPADEAEVWTAAEAVAARKWRMPETAVAA